MVDGDEVSVMSSDLLLLVERGGGGAIIPTRQDHVVIHLHNQSRVTTADLHLRDPIIIIIPFMKMRGVTIGEGIGKVIIYPTTTLQFWQYHIGISCSALRQMKMST